MSPDEMSADHELHAFSSRLERLRQTVKEAIGKHTQMLKTAAKAGWPEQFKDPVEEARRAMLLAHSEMSAELQRAESYIKTKYGISLSDLEDEPNTTIDFRWWRHQLTPEVMPATRSVEDALESGIEAVLNLVPSNWRKRQYEICRRELENRNAQPFMLVGNARYGAAALANPFGYAMYLSELLRDKEPALGGCGKTGFGLNGTTRSG